MPAASSTSQSDTVRPRADQAIEQRAARGNKRSIMIHLDAHTSHSGIKVARAPLSEAASASNPVLARIDQVRGKRGDATPAMDPAPASPPTTSAPGECETPPASTASSPRRRGLRRVKSRESLRSAAKVMAGSSSAGVAVRVEASGGSPDEMSQSGLVEGPAASDDHEGDEEGEEGDGKTDGSGALGVDGEPDDQRREEGLEASDEVEGVRDTNNDTIAIGTTEIARVEVQADGACGPVEAPVEDFAWEEDAEVIEALPRDESVPVETPTSQPCKPPPRALACTSQSGAATAPRPFPPPTCASCPATARPRRGFLPSSGPTSGPRHGRLPVHRPNGGVPHRASLGMSWCWGCAS
ncbi:hypothetical protein BDK51DRAFT_46406 [Blyttiomyces helicus]|uniref:Uncharacterized protein n=1 Tax=Blyttiomyces helicus TaxID=388810 RepID=A0A4P9VUL7_9FUNG|nr:hypothetical protein BDK51DRAFT_46406 [Blyttiomyces helicus]|eukprot:RKO82792.1 hypothetical protein BDK51DRAFT_46406 [Blyttiomyces helicus]